MPAVSVLTNEFHLKTHSALILSIYHFSCHFNYSVLCSPFMLPSLPVICANHVTRVFRVVAEFRILVCCDHCILEEVLLISEDGKRLADVLSRI